MISIPFIKNENEIRMIIANMARSGMRITGMDNPKTSVPAPTDIPRCRLDPL